MTVQGPLERALRHFDLLVEHGLLDAIDREVETIDLEESELSVLHEHVGEYEYEPPAEKEIREAYADAFRGAVGEISRKLWPLRGPF
ncbi:hypothetical protein BH18ACT15_BH18ACT15_11820 [soil metagenome]